METKSDHHLDESHMYGPDPEYAPDPDGDILDELIGVEFDISVAKKSVEWSKDDWMHNLRVVLADRMPEYVSTKWIRQGVRYMTDLADGHEEQTHDYPILHEVYQRNRFLPTTNPIVHAYGVPTPPGIGTLLEKVARGDIVPVTERERSRRTRELQSAFANPLIMRTKYGRPDLLNIGTGMTVSGDWPVCGYVAAESQYSHVGLFPTSYVPINLYPPKYQGHPSAINHIGDSKMIKYIEGDTIDLIGLYVHGLRRNAAIPAEDYDPPEKFTREWLLRDHLLLFESRVEGSKFLPSARQTVDMLWKDNIDLGRFWSELAHFGWDMDERHLPSEITMMVYARINARALQNRETILRSAGGKVMYGFKPRAGTGRQLWTDERLDVICDYYATRSEYVKGFDSDLQVSGWLRSQIDAGLLAITLIGEKGGSPLPWSGLGWLAVPDGQAVDSEGKVWSVKDGAYRLPIAGMKGPEGLWKKKELWDTVDYQRRLMASRYKITFQPLEYITATEQEEEKAPSDLAVAVESIDLVTTCALPISQNDNELAKLVWRALSEATIIDTVSQSHKRVESGERVCCVHVSLAMEHGYSYMLNQVATRTGICQYCGVNIGEPMLDVFEGFHTTTQRTSGDILAETLREIGLAEGEEEKGEGDGVGGEGGSQAGVIRLPQTIDKLQTMAANKVGGTSIPPDFRLYILWIWSQLSDVKMADIEWSMTTIEAICSGKYLNPRYNFGIMDDGDIKAFFDDIFDPKLHMILQHLLQNKSDVMGAQYGMVRWFSRFLVTRAVVASHRAAVRNITNPDQLDVFWQYFGDHFSIENYLFKVGEGKITTIGSAPHHIMIADRSSRAQRRFEFGVGVDYEMGQIAFNYLDRTRKINVFDGGGNGFDIMLKLIKLEGGFVASRDGGGGGGNEMSGVVLQPVRTDRPLHLSVLGMDWVKSMYDRYEKAVGLALTGDLLPYMFGLMTKSGGSKKSEGLRMGDMVVSTLLDDYVAINTHTLCFNYEMEHMRDILTSIADEGIDVIIPNMQNSQPKPLHYTLQQICNYKLGEWRMTEYNPNPAGKRSDLKIMRHYSQPVVPRPSPRDTREAIEIAKRALPRGSEEHIMRIREGHLSIINDSRYLYTSNILKSLNTIYRGLSMHDWSLVVPEARASTIAVVTRSTREEDLGQLSVGFENYNSVRGGEGLQDWIIDERPMQETQNDQLQWMRTLLAWIYVKISTQTHIPKVAGKAPDSYADFLREIVRLIQLSPDAGSFVDQSLKYYVAHVGKEPSEQDLLLEACHIRLLIVKKKKIVKQRLTEDHELRERLKLVDKKKRQELLGGLDDGDDMDDDMQMDDTNDEQTGEESDPEEGDGNDGEEFDYADEGYDEEMFMGGDTVWEE